MQKKVEDKSGEFSIESSSLDEEALKDLSSKAGIQKAYEVPKVQAQTQNNTNTTTATPASTKKVVAQTDDSKVGGFGIEVDGLSLDDNEEPKPALAANKTSNTTSQSLHINVTAMVMNSSNSSSTLVTKANDSVPTNQTLAKTEKVEAMKNETTN